MISPTEPPTIGKVERDATPSEGPAIVPAAMPSEGARFHDGTGQRMVAHHPGEPCHGMECTVLERDRMGGYHVVFDIAPKGWHRRRGWFDASQIRPISPTTGA